MRTLRRVLHPHHIRTTTNKKRRPVRSVGHVQTNRFRITLFFSNLHCVWANNRFSVARCRSLTPIVKCCTSQSCTLLRFPAIRDRGSRYVTRRRRHKHVAVKCSFRLSLQHGFIGDYMRVVTWKAGRVLLGVMLILDGDIVAAVDIAGR